MAVSSLLLPLLCVVLCELQPCGTRPLDFVCSPAARKSMNIIGVLEEAVIQQKLSSVCASLGVLLQALETLRDHWHLPCQVPVLQRLEHNVQNHQHILSKLDLPKTSTCSQGTLEPQHTNCKNQWTESLGQTLQVYNRLLRGPLELLLVELCNYNQDPSGSI